MTYLKTSISIGIDVSKKHFDTYCYSDSCTHRFTNDEKGIKKFIKWILSKGDELLVVLEPSGGYERMLEHALHEKNIAFAKVNAKRIRDFAKAKGRLAKTDTIDAKIISEYGIMMKPRIAISISKEKQTLKDFIIRRKQLTKIQADEANRLEKAKSEIAIESIQMMLTNLKNEIKNLDKKIHDFIKAHKTLWKVYKLLQDVCGIGPVIASTLLTDLPELGHISHKSISSLIGVAPHNVDSGMMRGKRYIQGGRGHIRNALYLAALTAARYDGPIRDFYTSLTQRGKKPKVALIACVRKMIIILNAKMRDFYQLTT